MGHVTVNKMLCYLNLFVRKEEEVMIRHVDFTAVQSFSKAKSTLVYSSQSNDEGLGIYIITYTSSQRAEKISDVNRGVRRNFVSRDQLLSPEKNMSAG